MNQGMGNTVVSAIVGGIVGAGVVFFAGGSVDLKNVELESLKVAQLTITEKAVLHRDGAENPDVIIENASVMAENVILGKKVVALQVQGQAVVANRLLASPDDLFRTPIDQWRFYAEVGASHKDGGEFVVRSANGPAMIDKPINNGSLFRMGYDVEQRPQMLSLVNPVLNQRQIEINYALSEGQRQQMMESARGNQQGMPSPGPFNGEGINLPQGGQQSIGAAGVNVMQ